MWLGLFLLILFPFLAYAVARTIWYCQYDQRDPDSNDLPQQSHFIVLASLYLGIGMVLSIPLIVQWQRDHQLRVTLLEQPLIVLMAKYQPQLYQNLLNAIRQNARQNTQNDQEIVLKSILKLREQWFREVPYASTEAITRFIRYRYDEAALLGKQDQKLCALLDQRSLDDLASSHGEFMLTNSGIVKEAMRLVFSTADPRRRLSYVEQRYAAKQSRLIHEQLAKTFQINESSVIAPQNEAYMQQSCRYQQAYYLALLDYTDQNMEKIVRWSMIYREQQSVN